MKYLKALVMMQLKDKLDFGFMGSKHKLISKIVLSVLKFLIITAVAYGVFTICSLLKIFALNGGIPDKLMIIVYGIIFILSLFSCTIGLMKNLYFAEDNKVLITFPVNGNLIFLSRLIIYYIFELKRSLFLTIPIFLSFGIIAKLSWFYFLWLPFVFLFISAIPVLVGAVLSIPAMYIYRFLRRVPGLFILFYGAITALVVYLVVALIGVLPENIDLTLQLGEFRNSMYSIMNKLGRYFFPVNFIVYMICGSTSGYYNFLDYRIYTTFLTMLASLALVGVAVFFISRPLFFSMMSKSFEYEKKIEVVKKANRKRGKFRTFLVTELKDFMRSGMVSSFMGVYIAVPVLTFIINKIFCAIDTRTAGQYMVYSFNFLLILLPVLASNALIATIYSRGGRASYVTKTMPLNPILPLTIKMLPLIVCSAISLCSSVAIFGHLARVSAVNIILISVAFVFIQWGHMLWSATLDLMNPQNEQYATTGGMDNNPNENKATIIAFIISALFAILSFVLFSKDNYANKDLRVSIKLLVLGLLFLSGCIYMYVNKIKVYYSEK